MNSSTSNSELRLFVGKLVPALAAIWAMGVLLAVLFHSLPFRHTYERFEAVELLDKYRHFDRHRDSFNSVFIGSSKIYRQLDPLVFDAHTDGLTHSFNAAYANLFPYRTLDFVRYGFARPNGIEWVFIELSPLARIDGNFDAPPNLCGMQAARFRAVLDFCRKSSYPPLYRARYLAGYSLLMLYKYSGFGMASYLVAELGLATAPASTPPAATGDLLANRGFYSLDAELRETGRESLARRRQQFQRRATVLIERSRQESGARPSAPSAAPDAYAREYRQVAEELRALGKTVVFVLPPHQRQMDAVYARQMQEWLADFICLDLADPQAQPEFYQEEYLFDQAHLNQAGALLLSRRAAALFRQAVADRHANPTAPTVKTENR